MTHYARLTLSVCLALCQSGTDEAQTMGKGVGKPHTSASDDAPTVLVPTYLTHPSGATYSPTYLLTHSLASLARVYLTYYLTHLPG